MTSTLIPGCLCCRRYATARPSTPPPTIPTRCWTTGASFRFTARCRRGSATARAEGRHNGLGHQRHRQCREGALRCPSHFMMVCKTRLEVSSSHPTLHEVERVPAEWTYVRTATVARISAYGGSHLLPAANVNTPTLPGILTALKFAVGHPSASGRQTLHPTHSLAQSPDRTRRYPCLALNRKQAEDDPGRQSACLLGNC